VPFFFGRLGPPDALKLTERFTRTAQDRIEWVVTVDDPTTWSRPWTFRNILNAARTAESTGRR